MKINHSLDYRRLRAAAYPPFAELADALVHQSLGNPQPLADYIAKCVAVKERFPKESPQRSTPLQPPGKPR